MCKLVEGEEMADTCYDGGVVQMTQAKDKRKPRLRIPGYQPIQQFDNPPT